jgi:hypothetical protein
MATSAEAVVFSASRETDLCMLLRLMGMVRNSLVPSDTVVVDLSRVQQFGRYGTELLCKARQRADRYALSMRVVADGDGDIARLLHQTGVAHRFARYDDLAGALDRDADSDSCSLTSV